MAAQYARLKKAPQNQNFKVWLQEWKRLYTKYKELKLPKVDGSYLVTDFIYTVKLIILNWLEYWKNKLNKHKQEKNTLSTFFKLVEIY